jgi:hypothetical protein
MNTSPGTYTFRPLVFTIACVVSLVVAAVIAPMDAAGSYFAGYLFLFLCGIGLVLISGRMKKMRYFRAGITLLYTSPILPIVIFIAAGYLKL